MIFLYLVRVLQALVDIFVPISTHTRLFVWMNSPPRWLAREKAAR